MSKSTICIQNIVVKFRRGGKENFIPVKRTKFFFKCFFKKDLTYVQGYIKKNCISSTLLMTN